MEKLSPKESVEGADTVLRGSVRAPEGFSEGKPCEEYYVILITLYLTKASLDSM